VAREVIPHEGEVRAWLARPRLPQEDIDDLIQESYCRLSALDSVDHIDRPDAYFFSIARNLMVRRLKRAQVVPIDAIAEIEAYADDAHPSPEQQAGSRLDLARMRGFLAALPERCRRIVELRKLEDCTQREIAARLGVTESVVENEVYNGVQALLRAWRAADAVTALRLQQYEAEEERRR
jgi:RNA polymerase sigma-70 factor (ECF subfamily)